MIINTGMRTDIPAFYSEWLMNRIHEGFVYVRNPYYMLQVSRYDLSPEVVDCLAFCTKNPHPMLKYLDELKEKYNMFWFVTITPYGEDIEPNVPSLDKVISDFKVLSLKLGKNTVALRYDPIFFSEEWTIEKHIRSFEYILKELEGYTEDVTISFLDMYEKVKKNAPNIRPPRPDEEQVIAKEFARIGEKYNMTIHGCCENPNLKDLGIDISGCMSKEIVEKAINMKLNTPKNLSKRLNDGKQTCNCVMGNDIGAYNSCMHLCTYCYANLDKELVKQNYKKHNPNSPFLIGEPTNEDRITSSKQKSWRLKEDNEQIRFF